MISKEELDKWKAEAETWMWETSAMIIDQTYAVRIVKLVEEIDRLQKKLDELGKGEA